MVALLLVSKLFTMLSPNPIPPDFVVKLGWKILGIICSEIPVPLSITLIM